MGEIEPIHWISGDESPSNVEAITASGDFRSANKPERFDMGPSRRNAQKHLLNTEDEVILSDVAEVSLREEEGMSVTAIAADLGLTAGTVLTDIVIASAICHPSESVSPLAHCLPQKHSNP